jgi:hypothetical protein
MNTTAHPSAEASSSRQSGLFTALVFQQANMALLFLGRTPRPDADQPKVDLEAASQFIDMLDMLEVKTRGNLTSEEATFLKETLMSLRIAFVEVADRTATPTRPASHPAAAAATPPTPDAPSAEAGAAKADAAPSPGEAEERKKFVKRY